jgi:hypothetical protein
MDSSFHRGSQGLRLARQVFLPPEPLHQASVVRGETWPSPRLSSSFRLGTPGLSRGTVPTAGPIKTSLNSWRRNDVSSCLQIGALIATEMSPLSCACLKTSGPPGPLCHTPFRLYSVTTRAEIQGSAWFWPA